MPVPHQPIRETIGPDRLYARVWRSVSRMTPEQRRSRVNLSVRIDGDRVIVVQGVERLVIERIEDDRYVVEATSEGIAVMSIMTLIGEA